jgi:hypothetical protein
MQARLAALFATYGQQLASEISAPAATATVAGAAGRSPKAAAAVLQYLRQLEAADGWHGVNRALLHGLLFAAWAASSGLRKPAASPADEWAIDSDWRLSTGTRLHTPALCRQSGMSSISAASSAWWRVARLMPSIAV